jgi:magnesium-transporting ATPase (P-type)
LLAEKAGIRGTHLRLHLNFESIRKRMSVVVKRDRSDEPIVYVRGTAGNTATLRSDLMGNEVRLLQTMITDGSSRERLHGEPSSSPLPLPTGTEICKAHQLEQIEDHLIFLGLAALSDPVRPEVPEAIRACHTAGIRVIMITGDYALTAASIGNQIGLGQSSPLQAFTGAQVSEMDDDKMRSILAQGETIFARVAPEHKLRIVSLLKRWANCRGHR